MKNWKWMLVMPYVVQYSSGVYSLKFRTGPDLPHSDLVFAPSILILNCTEGKGSDCQWIHDLADALNEAHERRTNAIGVEAVPQADPQAKQDYVGDPKYAPTNPHEMQGPDEGKNP